MNCKDATVNCRNVIARSSILMCFLDINLEFPNNLYLLQSYTISLARSAAFYISQTQFECTKFITQRLLHMGSIPHICQVIYTITIWGVKILHLKMCKFVTKWPRGPWWPLISNKTMTEHLSAIYDYRQCSFSWHLSLNSVILYSAPACVGAGHLQDWQE